jgi:hypothetical protein
MMFDGDDTDPAWVIVDGVRAKALKANHRVPIRNLKKRRRSVAAGEWTTLPAGLTTICRSPVCRTCRSQQGRIGYDGGNP